VGCVFNLPKYTTKIALLQILLRSCLYILIYLYIEKFGVCSGGGLDPLSLYIIHHLTVCHIYLYPYIIISLYPYSTLHFTYCWSHLISLYTQFFYHPITLHTQSFYTRSLYLILVSSRNFFILIIINTHVRIKAITTAKLGYSFIVVTSPTVVISTAMKNTGYVISCFIFISVFGFTLNHFIHLISLYTQSLYHSILLSPNPFTHYLYLFPIL